MKIGDLVKHSRIKNTRQLGVITKCLVTKIGTKDRYGLYEPKYRVYWLCMQKEEYWLTSREVEAL